MKAIVMPIKTNIKLCEKYEEIVQLSHESDEMFGSSQEIDEDVLAIVNGEIVGDFATYNNPDKKILSPEELQAREDGCKLRAKERAVSEKSKLYDLTQAIRHGDKAVAKGLKNNVKKDAFLRMLPVALEGGLTDLADEILGDIKDTENNRYIKIAVREAVLLAAKKVTMDSFRSAMSDAEDICAFLYGIKGDAEIKKHIHISMSGGGKSPIDAAMKNGSYIALDVAVVLHNKYGFSTKRHIKNRGYIKELGLSL